MPDSPRLRSAFVPHDLAAPIPGVVSRPLAGLMAAVKDMYDIQGERTGCGNPEWLANHAPAMKTAGAVQKILNAGATVIGKTAAAWLMVNLSGNFRCAGMPLIGTRPSLALRQFADNQIRNHAFAVGCDFPAQVGRAHV